MIPRNLLTLPNLIISKILNYFNSITLRKLRLVSHTIKAWIENESKLLKKLKCKIDNEETLKEIINSEVPWNNIIVINDDSWNDGFLGTKEFLRFLSKFGDSIKYLIVSSPGLNSDNVLYYLQYIGPQLENLCIEAIPSYSTIVFECPSKTTNNEPNSFYNLECLSYMSNGDSADLKADIMSELLPCCPNLNKIRFSRLYPNKQISMTQAKIYAQGIIYGPLIKYLTKRTKSSGTNNKLNIELSGCEGIVNPMIDSEPFPINYSTLLEMFQLCYSIGAKLWNVPSTVLPLKEYIKWTRKEIQNFENVISSITLINEETGLQNIYIPKSSRINVNIHTTSEQDFSTFELYGQVYIIKLQLDYMFSPFIGLDNLYQNLFHVHRPSMKELIVHKNNLDYFASGLVISTNFPNLKKLEITLWNENAANFQILINGLPHLEDLTFSSCKNCTDEALLGTDFKNPLICQLKKLLHLKLAESSITNLTFQHALCHMKLKTFEWSSFNLFSNLVTFENGISRLASVENGFRDFVEIFSCEVPIDCSHEDLNKLISSFRYLKVSRLTRIL